jgi:peptide chain release factor 1
MKIEKYEKIVSRHQELEKLLADSQIIANKNEYQKLAKEYSDLTPVAEAYSDYKKISAQIEETQNLLEQKQDRDFEELAKAEMKDLQQKQEELLKRLDDLTNPHKQVKDRALIIEIRAGTGGEEASLFAADLYRMYTRYADQKGWKVESISLSESGTGGFKEVVFSIIGPGAERRLQWESGAHRVQRVPSTEASGRIHTSAATVVVLFEPEEIDIKINPADLKVDVFRSSGPGGQSVNTTDSAVRMTHIPTGVVVVCQDERSQLKNRLKAMRVMRARLHDKIQQDNIQKLSQDRKSKIGTGDRSEKIRTYNFPDHRVTDHRIGFTTHQLSALLDGDLDELTDALIKAQEEEAIK